MTVDHSFEERLTARRAAVAGGSFSPGGSGPDDPTIPGRLAVVEADLKDVKSSLKALEISAVRIEAALGTLATKSDVAVLTERMAAHTARLATLEDANRTTITMALSKTVGIGGAISLFVSLATLLGIAVALLRYFRLI